MMSFIEDVNGSVIDGHRASSICKATRQIWSKLSASGLAPKTWAKITMNTLIYFRNRMYEQFPELSYCDSHWKLDKLATDTYSQWNGEKASGVNGTISVPTTIKRSSVEPNVLPVAKKLRSGSKLKKSSKGKCPVHDIGMSYSWK
jgi:hypothetical protein